MSRKIIQVLIILGLALLYAGSRIKVIELGYEVSKLKNQVAEMTRTNGLLKSQVAQGHSIAKLADWVNRLGFSAPETSQVLFVNE